MGGAGGGGGTGGAGGADGSFVDGLSSFGDGAHCAMGADGGPSATHILYLNFEGVTLTYDQSANDATMNKTFLIPSTPATRTVPPFMNNDAMRTSYITSIVTHLQGLLAPYDVELVQTRPASGGYMMIVFGGDSQSIVGRGPFGAYAPFDCGNRLPNDIMLVFDPMANTPVDAAGVILANFCMFDLGLAIGLSASTPAGDCLSRQTSSMACTLSDMAPVDPAAYCQGAAAQQDEPSAFAAALGCR